MTATIFYNLKFFHFLKFVRNYNNIIHVKLLEHFHLLKKKRMHCHQKWKTNNCSF